ncbi:YsnF/AvaK domain-containing protein [Planococcus sp. CAU13]|uniref:YsnF/AvaK domain-containing protein n=1 Tax=Planococcus sp. CAU13 TaxID=1541197 RepID=UPI00068BE32C|nr:YsnF/AvaK domain-containing protein [Planococcus sp. CAU13]
MENKGNKQFGFFGGQLEVQDKIKELKKEGHPPDSLYVIAKSEDQVRALRLYDGVHFSTEEEGGWIDKFKGMFSGSHTLANVFEEMGFTREEAEDYNRRIDNGEIFLFADDEVFTGTESASNTGAVTNTGGAAVGSHGTGTEQQGQPTMSRTQRRRSQSGNDEESLLLHEEQLEIHKERLQTGEINVNKRIVEEQMEMDVPVERDDVIVERRPVSDMGNETGEVRTEPYHVGDELHIPVVEERLVVTKKEVVTEEIVVTKRKIRDTEHITETVRREEVDINDSGLPGGGKR